MTDQTPIDLLNDVLSVLDADDALLASENTAIQAEISMLTVQLIALQNQLNTNQQEQTDSLQLRNLITNIKNGSMAGSLVVPASVSLPPSSNPVTDGFIKN